MCEARGAAAQRQELGRCEQDEAEARIQLWCQAVDERGTQTLRVLHGLLEAQGVCRRMQEDAHARVAEQWRTETQRLAEEARGVHGQREAVQAALGQQLQEQQEHYERLMRQQENLIGTLTSTNAMLKGDMEVCLEAGGGGEQGWGRGG